ncbi:hypothetical protein EJ04DRAFT_568939 [Polyplosphaeria fusca]|uniref:Uncharacterized protein n=1 Tax=Polyplosphaeria fusca TaxID=682080 RepID=A0A9P4QQJ2_9PLEO|nr:hypothetical protein EJ04DRAFT_568939 [Polyplosphaeria fusca]
MAHDGIVTLIPTSPPPKLRYNNIRPKTSSTVTIMDASNLSQNLQTPEITPQVSQTPEATSQNSTSSNQAPPDSSTSNTS